MAIEPSKPIFEDREGSIKLAVFKNQNVNKQKYPLICITVVKFPFKFCRKIYMTPGEAKKLKDLLERMPQIEVTQNPK